MWIDYILIQEQRNGDLVNLDEQSYNKLFIYSDEYQTIDLMYYKERLRDILMTRFKKVMYHIFRLIYDDFEAVTRFDFVPYPVMQGMSRMELELSEKLIKIISKWFEVLIDMYPMSKQEVEHIDEGLLLNVWRDSV